MRRAVLSRFAFFLPGPFVTLDLLFDDLDAMLCHTLSPRPPGLVESALSVLSASESPLVVDGPPPAVVLLISVSFVFLLLYPLLLSSLLGLRSFLFRVP
jgi:hypothetical protein